MDVQIANDYTQFLDRLDKRTHDLRLARQITIQQAPQIRLIQNTNQALAEKSKLLSIQRSHYGKPSGHCLDFIASKDAVTAQRQVSETTNDLLKKNSEMLKVSAIETAKENERGIVDIETLQKHKTTLWKRSKKHYGSKKKEKKTSCCRSGIGSSRRRLERPLIDLTSNK